MGFAAAEQGYFTTRVFVRLVSERTCFLTLGLEIHVHFLRAQEGWVFSRTGPALCICDNARCQNITFILISPFHHQPVDSSPARLVKRMIGTMTGTGDIQGPPQSTNCVHSLVTNVQASA